MDNTNFIVVQLSNERISLNLLCTQLFSSIPTLPLMSLITTTHPLQQIIASRFAELFVRTWHERTYLNNILSRITYFISCNNYIKKMTLIVPLLSNLSGIYGEEKILDSIYSTKKPGKCSFGFEYSGTMTILGIGASAQFHHETERSKCHRNMCTSMISIAPNKVIMWRYLL